MDVSYDSEILSFEKIRDAIVDLGHLVHGYIIHEHNHSHGDIAHNHLHRHGDKGNKHDHPHGIYPIKQKGGELMAIDPVCRMLVSEDKAVARTEYKGKTYYFCAKICKEKFEKEPEKYLQKER